MLRLIVMVTLALAALRSEPSLEVVSSTKNMRVPWSNSSLLGEVYLAN